MALPASAILLTPMPHWTQLSQSLTSHSSHFDVKLRLFSNYNTMLLGHAFANSSYYLENHLSTFKYTKTHLLLNHQPSVYTLQMRNALVGQLSPGFIIQSWQQFSKEGESHPVVRVPGATDTEGKNSCEPTHSKGTGHKYRKSGVSINLHFYISYNCSL